MAEFAQKEFQEMKQGLKKAFDASDTDRSGSIDAGEIGNVLANFNKMPECKEKLSPEEIKKVSANFVQKADKNGDGKLNFEEYFTVMMSALKTVKPGMKSVPQSGANGSCCQQ